MKSCKYIHQASVQSEGFKKNQNNLPFQKSLGRLALDNHITLIAEDDISVAAFVTGFIVEGIIIQRHWQSGNMTEKQRKAVWIVMLAITERLSQMLNTTTEEVVAYAAMWVFRDDNSYLFGTCIREMNDEYLVLKEEIGKRVLLALLNRSITNLFSDGDITNTKHIARVTGMLAGSLEPLLQVH